LSIAFGRFATANDEVDLSVGQLERTIGVAPFRWWRWRSLLAVVVVAVVVVLATSIISGVTALVVTVITLPLRSSCRSLLSLRQ
jgi:hypothetical protein